MVKNLLDLVNTLETNGKQGPETISQPQPDREEEHQLPLHSRFPMERLLHRAHVGLGHPTTDRFVRILRYAKEIIEAAKHLKCSVCARHAQIKPARRSAPPKEL